MKTQTNGESARVQTYSFDNDSLVFSIDHGQVREAVQETPDLVDALVGLALKTLIHRTSTRPTGKGEDATEWLIEAIAGGEAGGFPLLFPPGPAGLRLENYCVLAWSIFR